MKEAEITTEQKKEKVINKCIDNFPSYIVNTSVLPLKLTNMKELQNLTE
jgi:hypothetical protein